MKVSIAVITFNQEKYIAQAIDSILMQEVNFDYEIVIGEDCSTDRTRLIVQDFQKRYPDKIRLLLPDKHLGGAKNFALVLQACHGQYIAILNGDDYWTSPHKLQKQVDFLDENPECAMCFHNVRVVYEDGSREPYDFNPINQKEISTLEELLAGNFIQTCSAMFRRDLLDKVPDWLYTIVPQDWATYILITQHGMIGYINEVMGVYRRHSGGVFYRLNRIQHLEKAIRFYEVINEKLGLIYDKTIRIELSRRYYDLARQYESQGDFDKAAACLRKCIDGHPAWLEGYLPEKGSLGKKVWKYLDKKMWYYNHPLLYRLWFKSLCAPLQEFKALLFLIFRIFPKTVCRLRNKRTGILTADPNPIRQVNHPEEVSMTTLTWTTFGVEKAEVHVGAPDGPLFFGNEFFGRATTGEWVHDGIAFYLQDVTDGLPLTYANTLDIAKINVITGKRGVVQRISDLLVEVIEEKKKKLLAKTFDSIWAYPNPIPVSISSETGKTTVFWSCQDTKTVEIHVDSPDGPLLSRSGSSGKATTGAWVHDGMFFYLQDVSEGKPLTFANTLDIVKVNLIAGGWFVNKITRIIDWTRKNLLHFLKTKYEVREKTAIKSLDYSQPLSSEERYLMDLLRKFDFFDPAWYLSKNTDVQKRGEDPWVHFVRYGVSEHRQPNPFFDPAWYLNFYDDIRNTGVNPLLHFLQAGLHQGRKPNSNADPLYNLKTINLLAVEHCTIACQYCSTSSPFSKKISHPASSFFQWLDLLELKRIPFINIAITGGEPFLHRDIGAFIHELREHYPFKRIGVTTNFYWANENTIRLYAPTIQLLTGGLYISLYGNLISKLGGLERFKALVSLLRDLCPETTIQVGARPNFVSWKLHLDKREVKDTCITSDCYILRADGKVSHCSIGAGLENRPEYSPIINLSKERLFDLSKGVDGFLSWALKYPFDLCFHCTMWRHISTPWRMDTVKGRIPSDRSIGDM
jgi:glycosyltransferase involved in cell wall biosynthesis